MQKMMLSDAQFVIFLVGAVWNKTRRKVPIIFFNPVEVTISCQNPKIYKNKKMAN